MCSPAACVSGLRQKLTQRPPGNARSVVLASGTTPDHGSGESHDERLLGVRGRRARWPVLGLAKWAFVRLHAASRIAIRRFLRFVRLPARWGLTGNHV
jgi:hypothetical protein